MCFTWKGRLTARLIGLIGPALAALVFWLATGQSDYWVLFGFMATVGLALDVTLYNMLIGYQPRWLTLALGAGEYLILREVVMWPWPSPLVVRLFEHEAAWFYVCGWVLAQVILQAVVPVLWLSWGDDGGELRRGLLVLSARRWGWRWGTLVQRRQAFALALLGLGLAMLPTLVGAWTCPPGMRYTGLLVNTASHLSLLAGMTRWLGYSSGPSGGLAEWVRAWPEFLEASGDLPLIPVYHAARAVTGLLALAGVYSLVQRLTTDDGPQMANGLWRACALMYALLLPALIAATPLTLWLLAAILFGLAALPLPPLGQWVSWRRLFIGLKARYWVGAGLAALGLAVWLLAWAGLSRSPVAYLDEGEWQALAWLHQSTATDAPVVAEPRLAPLVTALAGRPTLPAPDPGRSVYVLGQGAACARDGVSFQSRSVCIWWLLPDQD